MVTEDRALRVRELLDAVRAEGRTTLTAPEGKVIADAYGIAVPGEELARDADEAVACAARLGGPVVMKIVSADILHKTAARSSRTRGRTTYGPASRAYRSRNCCRGGRRSSSGR
jgi:acyl-CoA synthetase (NDP forming)